MQSVSLTMTKRINVLALICFGLISGVKAQTLNSPYSRYGIGNTLSNQNILTRAMGGVASAYGDYQTINFYNPASYGNLQTVTYDVGLELENLTIRSFNPVQKFSNASPIISNVNLGIPLKKNGGWGLVFGLRPNSRIGYKVLKSERLNFGSGATDSVSTLFEGNGGTQQVFLGTGFRIKRFTFGANLGYMFGSKDHSTRRIFINDSLLYAKSNSETKSNFYGFVVNAGAQYNAKLNNKYVLRMGAQATLQQNLKATRDVVRETYNYDANGAELRIDSVYAVAGQTGRVLLPLSYSAGFILDKSGQWQIGVEYAAAKWSKYRYFGETDQVQDSWEIRTGGQLIPKAGKSYWGSVAYRAGFNYGVDYIAADGDLKKFSFTFGAGLPMRRVTYTNQFSIINTSLEFGQRGTNASLVKENFVRFSVAFSMSDIWFIKRKYD